MFAAMSGLIAFYVSSNLSMQQKMNIDEERAKEQITITQITLTSENKIVGITVSNTGAIESKIRALYREENGVVTLLTDPSTYIQQGSSKTLNVASLGLIASPNSMIFAATERGVRSQGANEIQLANENQEKFPDTSTLTIGPLRLSFNSLNWASSSKQGSIGAWQSRWTIPTGYCAWRLNLTNVDDKNRTITINKYSGFSINKVSAPQTQTWFLKATQQIVAWNETQPVTFLWDDPVSRSTSTNAGNEQKGVNNVYLTIFGSYSDGQEYSQTVPFQAITVT